MQAVRTLICSAAQLRRSTAAPGLRAAPCNCRPFVMAATEEIDVEGLQANYRGILQKVQSAQEAAGAQHVKLVAVSKYKPVEAIQVIYDAGHRDFGENYAQELCDKADKLPGDIQWRFIGGLQSNKAKMLVAIPNLACVETVGSVKLANKLHQACASAERTLSVMVQVNTSDEDQKSGVAPSEAAALAQHILKECPTLRLDGLMTIGAAGEDPTPFFKLSMGMSGDFETAIACGSTSVRVGSSIFGARAPKAA